MEDTKKIENGCKITVAHPEEKNKDNYKIYNINPDRFPIQIPWIGKKKGDIILLNEIEYLVINIETEEELIRKAEAKKIEEERQAQIKKAREKAREEKEKREREIFLQKRMEEQARKKEYLARKRAKEAEERKKANEYLEKIWAEKRIEEQQRIEEERKQEAERKENETKIQEFLTSFDFKSAGAIYKKTRCLNEERWLELKTASIQNWFLKNVTENNKPYSLDNEQARAIIDEKKNVLVSARAGSGKTRVIVAKIIYLVKVEKQKFEDILVLAFNHSTPTEINERLGKVYVNGEQFCKIDLCKTFHAVARDILFQKSNNPPVILSDDKERYVQEIIELKKKREPDFTKRVYRFFRDESFKVGRQQVHSEAQYYKSLRSERFTTLKGEYVKSLAEKYIADYLFEHGIKYVYEKEFYPYKINVDDSSLPEDKKQSCKDFLEKSKDVTKPDFYLCDYNIVWEHFAIIGNESVEEQIKITQSDAIGNYWEYFRDKEWKEGFWGGWRKYICLSNDDKYLKEIKSVKKLIKTEGLNCSREEFEGIIESKLRSEGIDPIKRNEEELIAEVWKMALKKFPEMITSFINRYQQRYADDELLFNIKKKKFKGEDRIYSFICIGKEIYDEYVCALKNQEIELNNKTYNKDFNQIIYDSTQILKNKSDKLTGWEKKYILIDEYQDFSKLFFDFVSALRSRRNGSKLFCVGDDWQMINRFAGSDNCYFSDFGNFFKETSIQRIHTNYRSDMGIIKYSNNFMKDYFDSDGAKYRPTCGIGIVEKVDIEKHFIDMKTPDKITMACKQEYEKTGNFIKPKYLRYLVDLIKDNPQYNFLILHRNNDFNKYEGLESFRQKLKKIMLDNKVLREEAFNDRVKFSTIHKSKGLQADIVVLLDVNEGIIPRMHPDNCLYEVFEETETDNFLDQARLFYVALTRAKHKLYIMYEGKNKSSFIKNTEPSNR